MPCRAVLNAYGAPPSIQVDGLASEPVLPLRGLAPMDYGMCRPLGLRRLRGLRRLHGLRRPLGSHDVHQVWEGTSEAQPLGTPPS